MNVFYFAGGGTDTADALKQARVCFLPNPANILENKMKEKMICFLEYINKSPSTQ